MTNERTSFRPHLYKRVFLIAQSDSFAFVPQSSCIKASQTHKIMEAAFYSRAEYVHHYYNGITGGQTFQLKISVAFHTLKSLVYKASL